MSQRSVTAPARQAAAARRRLPAGPGGGSRDSRRAAAIARRAAGASRLRRPRERVGGDSARELGLAAIVKRLAGGSRCGLWLREHDTELGLARAWADIDLVAGVAPRCRPVSPDPHTPYPPEPLCGFGSRLDTSAPGTPTSRTGGYVDSRLTGDGVRSRVAITGGRTVSTADTVVGEVSAVGAAEDVFAALAFSATRPPPRPAKYPEEGGTAVRATHPNRSSRLPNPVWCSPAPRRPAPDVRRH